MRFATDIDVDRELFAGRVWIYVKEMYFCCRYRINRNGGQSAGVFVHLPAGQEGCTIVDFEEAVIGVADNHFCPGVTSIGSFEKGLKRAMEAGLDPARIVNIKELV